MTMGCSHQGKTFVEDTSNDGFEYCCQCWQWQGGDGLFQWADL
jgi:hypothetical protein